MEYGYGYRMLVWYKPYLCNSRHSFYIYHCKAHPHCWYIHIACYSCRMQIFAFLWSETISRKLIPMKVMEQMCSYIVAGFLHSYHLSLLKQQVMNQCSFQFLSDRTALHWIRHPINPYRWGILIPRKKLRTKFYALILIFVN